MKSNRRRWDERDFINFLKGAGAEEVKVLDNGIVQAVLCNISVTKEKKQPL